MNDSATKWEELLNPEITREKLISASLYIAAFEILKDSICDRIRSFYFVGFDQSGPITDSKYASEVLSRNRSPLYASLDWLIEQNAIEPTDVQSFERIKTVRNNLAHSLPSLMFAESSFGHIGMFQELVSLLRKIETGGSLMLRFPPTLTLMGKK